MQTLLMATSNGAYVPLSEVASFRTVGGMMNIARENGRRVLAIGVFIRGRDMGVIVANIPFSVIGGILALWITGIYLSVSAAIGFIALFGQAVLNGVVMVALFNDLRQSGKSAEEAATEGAITRLRTVLMTALLASLGLLPMALSHGIGSETQKPLAVVVIGGLVAATLLVLYVLPVLYVMLARVRRATPS